MQQLFNNKLSQNLGSVQYSTINKLISHEEAIAAMLFPALSSRKLYITGINTGHNLGQDFNKF